MSVISEIPGMGGHIATLLAPTWRASLGELQRLLVESTRRKVREKKPFELSRRLRVKLRPSRYNCAILKKFGQLPVKG